jgi:hypothetical protein
LGDEQVLDVELDRGTELRKENRDYNDEIVWRAKSSISLPVPAIDVPGKIPSTFIFVLVMLIHYVEYVKILKDLIPRFPLTQKDGRGRLPRGSGEIPYKLVTTHTMFKALIMGRRKAIEVRINPAIH